MKTAIYIEDGTVQLVITPESKFEQNSLSTLLDKAIDAKIYAGSFYDCRGGWVMQTAYKEPHGQFDNYDQNHKDNSLILTVREDRETE